MLVFYLIYVILSTDSKMYHKGGNCQMSYIDLHVHSNYSDGTLSPSQIVSLAIEKQLVAFALTDHDTVEGVEEAIKTAKEAANKGDSVIVIPGTELSASYNNEDIHILGLCLNHHNPTLLKALEEAKAEREHRNHKMCHKLLEAGIAITVDKMREDDKDAVLTRAHFAKFMLKEGYVSSMKEAFDKYLDSSSPYYVKRQYMTPKQAIELILKAEGVPVLAHPLLYKLSNIQLNALLKELKSYGLQGIEAIHSSNINNDESYVKQLARQHDLFITGGSDFHGSVKPSIDLGTGKGNLRIPKNILKNLGL